VPTHDSFRLVHGNSNTVNVLLIEHDREIATAVPWPPSSPRSAPTVPTDGQLATTTVDDDGPGVATGDRERIFDRFTRLDESRSSSAGGSGLGLAIVRDIVTRLGGTITIGVSPQGGARFTIVVPTDGTPLPAASRSDAAR
jgi:signal transduction histidine kinase